MTNEGNGLQAVSIANIGHVAQLFAFAVSVAYIGGFLVVTMYLGNYGIRDYDAFKIQYLVAGVQVFLVGGVFYYFIGRPLSTLDRDAQSYLEIFRSIGGEGAIWLAYSLVFPIVEIGCFVCVSVLITCSFLFYIPKVSTAFMLYMLFFMFGMGLIQFIVLPNIRKNQSKLLFILLGLFYVLALFEFVLLANGFFIKIFYFFLIFSFVGLQYPIIKTSSKKAPLAYLVIFTFFSFTTWYGKNFYAHVKASVGGGESEQVRVVVDDVNTPIYIKKELQVKDGVSTMLNLVAETGSDFFFTYPSKVSMPSSKASKENASQSLVRVERKLIKAVISNDVSEAKVTTIEQ
jgi:hypothetical protein